MKQYRFEFRVEKFIPDLLVGFTVYSKNFFPFKL